MKKIVISLFFLIVNPFNSQTIENNSALESFYKKLKDNNSVTNILYLGDSHTQAGWLTKILRNNFQTKYGNAGRGAIFPYSLANSNGPDDFSSYSNQAWETFRLVYDQDLYPSIGAMGFIMANQKKSFISIQFKNPEDQFDQVKIFNDQVMDKQSFYIYKSSNSLTNFVKSNKQIQNYTVSDSDNFYEIVAKFNTTTTRLVQLNGSQVRNPKSGQIIKVEKSEPIYDENFEQTITEIGKGVFTGIETTYNYNKETQDFLLLTNADKGNIFYGFQFLKRNANRGVVFNSVGVNGATYSDFTKYPLQLAQLKIINPDIVMIALGTNEALSNISKEEFFNNIKLLVDELRKDSCNLPIVLISPTDNNLNGKKTAEIVSWMSEASKTLNVSFIDLYKSTGGKGYFTKALSTGKANKDNVHFLKSGYEEQGEIIWKAFENYLK